MNNKINELYKTIEAKDKIIDSQALEIARLNKQVEMLKDYGEKCGERRNELYDKIDKAIEVVRLCNTKCSKEVIEILKGDDNE